MTANLIRIIKHMIEQVRFALSGPRAKFNRIDRSITQDGFNHLELSHYVPMDTHNLTKRTVEVNALTFREIDAITNLPLRTEPSDRYVHQLINPWLGPPMKACINPSESRDSIMISKFNSPWELKFMRIISTGMQLESSDNPENSSAIWDGWKHDFWPYFEPQFEDPEKLIGGLFIGRSGFFVTRYNKAKLDLDLTELDNLMGFCGIIFGASSVAYKI